MHTIRCSGGQEGGVYPSMHWAGRVCIPKWHWAGGCVSQNTLGRGGCIPACTGQGVFAQRDVWRGCLPRGLCHGVCIVRGCLLRGVCPGVVCPSACWDTSPCEQNHSRLWKHNLAATTLRTVNISYDANLWKWTYVIFIGSNQIRRRESKMTIHFVSVHSSQCAVHWRTWGLLKI